MYGIDQCDEIIWLIDDVLNDTVRSTNHSFTWSVCSCGS